MPKHKQVHTNAYLFYHGHTVRPNTKKVQTNTYLNTDTQHAYLFIHGHVPAQTHSGSNLLFYAQSTATVIPGQAQTNPRKNSPRHIVLVILILHHSLLLFDVVVVPCQHAGSAHFFLEPGQHGQRGFLTILAPSQLLFAGLVLLSLLLHHG